MAGDYCSGCASIEQALSVDASLVVIGASSGCVGVGAVEKAKGVHEKAPQRPPGGAV